MPDEAPPDFLGPIGAKFINFKVRPYSRRVQETRYGSVVRSAYIYAFEILMEDVRKAVWKASSPNPVIDQCLERFRSGQPFDQNITGPQGLCVWLSGTVKRYVYRPGGVSPRYHTVVTRCKAYDELDERLGGPNEISTISAATHGMPLVPTPSTAGEIALVTAAHDQLIGESVRRIHRAVNSRVAEMLVNRAPSARLIPPEERVRPEEEI